MTKQAGYEGAKKPVSPKGPTIDPSLKSYPYAPKNSHAPVGAVRKSIPSVVVPDKIKKAK